MRRSAHFAGIALLVAVVSVWAQEPPPQRAPTEVDLDPLLIEQALREDRSWLLMEQGRIALEHGEPGAALDLFLEARDVADREVYPEADLAIGDIWMAEGELGQAERSYLRAIEGLRIAPNLLIYKEVDYARLTVTLRERLAELYRLLENYGKMEEQYQAIVKMDRDFTTATLAERITANYLEAGLNRVLTLYRLSSGFAVRAHQELGWLYYRNGLYEKATPHSVYAVTNILSAAIAELRRADPVYTFVSVETTVRDGYRRPNIRAYLEEAGVWKALYYLAATTYARNSPARAREVWGILERTRDAGTYQGRAVRQLATPWVEPPLRDSSRR